ncbi:MAG: O-antigen ligase family protein [Coriobacteriales bacterium]
MDAGHDTLSGTSGLRTGVWIACALLCGSVSAVVALEWMQWPVTHATLYGTLTVTLFALGLISTDVGLALLVATIPLFDFATLGPPAAPFTAAHVLLASTILGWSARIVRDGRRALPRPTPLVAALAMPWLAGAISLAGSLAPSSTLSGTGRLLVLWLLAMLIAWRANDAHRGRALLAELVAVACVMAGVAALQYFDPALGIGRLTTQGFSSLVVLVRPSAFFLDPNFLAGYLSAAVLVALVFMVRATRMRQAVWWGAGALVALGGIAVTSSRSALIGLAVGLVVVLLTAPRQRRARLIVAVIVLTLVVAPFVPAAMYQRVAGLLDPTSEGSLATRYLMVQSSVEMLSEFGIGGTGLGAYDLAYPAYRKPGALPRITHPHQVPLAMWVEMGVPGALSVLAIVAGIVWAWRRLAKQHYPAPGTAALAAVTALVVESLFQYYLYFEYLWIFLGLLSAFSAVRQEGDDVRDER